jgi:transcription elongation factor
MNATKCRIKKDDKVKVIAGKDKGKIGKVLKVIRKKKQGACRKRQHGQTARETLRAEQAGRYNRRRGSHPLVEFDAYVQQMHGTDPHQDTASR